MNKKICSSFNECSELKGYIIKSLIEFWILSSFYRNTQVKFEIKSIGHHVVKNIFRYVKSVYTAKNFINHTQREIVLEHNIWYVTNYYNNIKSPTCPYVATSLKAELSYSNYFYPKIKKLISLFLLKIL